MAEPAVIVDIDRFETAGLAALRALVEETSVTVGVARGRCDGWRLAAAMCVDLLVAGPDAVFGGGGDAHDVVVRRGRAVAGRHVAAYLAATDRTVDAETAQRWGIVCAVAADPEKEAGTLAAGIGERSPVAVSVILRQTRADAARDLRLSQFTARR